MAIIYTHKQRDKQGNVWLRDNYGGWTNEFGVRFTKKEHRQFGYVIRKANRKIADFQKKYPTDKPLKATDVGSRYRSSDLARFRKKSAYKNYLDVTRRIISGKQLYVKEPKQYQKNMIKALRSIVNVQFAKENKNFKVLLEDAINKVKHLSNSDLIRLSKMATTPEINSYYTIIYDIQKTNIEQLINTINNL